MRKLLTGILTFAMVVSLAACGGAKDNETNKNNNEVNNNVENNAGTNEGENQGGTEDNGIIAPDVATDTLGYMLWENFVNLRKENPTATMEELAYLMLSTDVAMASIQMPMAMPVEVGGYLMAINEGESLSFKSGALFGSGMMGVAFLGYMFELDSAADAPAFIKTLKEKCDPAWNVCTTAEMTVAGAVDNYVFFVMCPMTAKSGAGEAVINYPDIVNEAVADGIWCAFEESLTMNPSVSSEGVAWELAMGTSTSALGNPVVSAVAPGTVAGFTVDVDGFMTAHSLTIEGNDSFVTYFFQLEPGMDAMNWASYYADCTNATQVFWGSYNEMVIIMMNTDIQ